MAPQRNDRMRRALAQEAARIMDEHGVQDFLLAKRKAAERLGNRDDVALPRNSEIEAALVERQRLFGGALHGERLQLQRRAALTVMRALDRFGPRLVGPVLVGTATANTSVQLHVFADRPEAVTLRLLDSQVRHELTERRVRLDSGRTESLPCVCFSVENQPVEAIIFPVDGIRQAPLSPVDGRPMRRADTAEVQSLLANGDQSAHSQ
jgi:hypothetical protein